MSLLSSINCSIGRHEPLRRQVRRDGRNYVGKCRHCGKAIHRVAHRDWRDQNA